MEKPLTFNEQQKPIGLPKTDVTVGAMATLGGWGFVRSPGVFITKLLKTVKVKILANDFCKAYLRNITPQHVCTFHSIGTGSCFVSFTSFICSLKN